MQWNERDTVAGGGVAVALGIGEGVGITVPTCARLRPRITISTRSVITNSTTRILDLLIA
ncbi:MAG TPA: hypothetical protein VKB84_26335 [Candidatus Binataceae bacterium]|nr:hypothetical protein [Candidatus Binataceae bacterium]